MGFIFFAVLLSVPFYYLWNWLAPIYAAHLPALYLHPPFWHCVGIFTLIAIVRVMLLPSFHCHKFSHKLSG